MLCRNTPELPNILIVVVLSTHYYFTEIPASPIWQLIRLINETMDDTNGGLTGTSLVGWKVYNVVIVSFGDRVYSSYSIVLSMLMLSAVISLYRTQKPTIYIPLIIKNDIIYTKFWIFP